EGVKRSPGLVGDGALYFDGSKEAFVDLGPAAYAPPQGITIEAVVAFEWNGEGYREIFRKNDDNRILLSFQNDDPNVPSIPSVSRGPCLAFGLKLENSDYSELDMPLDGQEGRPTVAQLADGKSHHIVATYSAQSAVKGIYIDGELCYSHKFEPGSKIIAGSGAPATLG